MWSGKSLCFGSDIFFTQIFWTFIGRHPYKFSRIINAPSFCQNYWKTAGLEGLHRTRHMSKIPGYPFINGYLCPNILPGYPFIYIFIKLLYNFCFYIFYLYFLNIFSGNNFSFQNIFLPSFKYRNGLYYIHCLMWSSLIRTMGLICKVSFNPPPPPPFGDFLVVWFSLPKSTHVIRLSFPHYQR